MNVHRNKFLYNKTNRCTNFQIYSGTKLYMFRAVPCPSPGVIHCKFGTGTCYTVLKTACVQDQDGRQFRPDPARKHVPVPNV